MRLQLTWWAFSSTTANIAALANDMFLGSDGDRTVFQVPEAAHTSILLFLCVSQRCRGSVSTG